MPNYRRRVEKWINALDSGKFDISSYYGYNDKDEDVLVNMNDHEGKNFSQIARWIEKNILPKVASR